MSATLTQPPGAPTRSEWLLAELARPAAYPFPVQSVETRRTLLSLLFFAGERVYKLKQELSKYNIDDDTLERILSVLEV